MVANCLRICALFLSVLLASCGGASFEKAFFEKPLEERMALAKTMNTPTVYKLYKFEASGNPATSEMAEILGRRGRESFDVLKSDLAIRNDLLHPSDYLPILDRECELSDFCVCKDSAALDEINRAILKPTMADTKLEISQHLSGLCGRYS